MHDFAVGFLVGCGALLVLLLGGVIFLILR